MHLPSFNTTSQALIIVSAILRGIVFSSLLAKAAAFYHNHAADKFWDIVNSAVADIKVFNRTQSMNTIIGISWNFFYLTGLLRYEYCLT